MNRVIGLCGAMLFLFAGCATTRYEEYGETPEGKMQALPLTTDAILPLQNALRDLQARVEQLEAELANRVSGLERANEGLGDSLATLHRQIQELQDQFMALQEGTGAANAQPQTQIPGDWDATTLYEQGLMAYHSRRYDEAKEIFRQVLSRDPSGDLADNAHYWIGECEYAMKDYRAALDSFRKIFSYTRTEKYDDAQLKIGLCYLQTGDDESALIELKRLVVDYPKSEYFGQAQELVQKIRGRLGSEP